MRRRIDRDDAIIVKHQIATSGSAWHVSTRCRRVRTVSVNGLGTKRSLTVLQEFYWEEARISLDEDS